MTRKFHYSGDHNVENGGVWYALDTWKFDYVDVVRVQPCSDAGGPSNCWWVEVLVVNLFHDEARHKNALNWYGVGADEYAALALSAKRHVLFDAMLHYGYYDTHSSVLVQIGKKQASYNRREGPFNPDLVLRGNASIKNYARAKVRALS